jgi:hypothetical protein
LEGLADAGPEKVTGLLMFKGVSREGGKLGGFPTERLEFGVVLVKLFEGFTGVVGQVVILKVRITQGKDGGNNGEGGGGVSSTSEGLGEQVEGEGGGERGCLPGEETDDVCGDAARRGEGGVINQELSF